MYLHCTFPTTVIEEASPKVTLSIRDAHVKEENQFSSLDMWCRHPESMSQIFYFVTQEAYKAQDVDALVLGLVIRYLGI